MTHEEWLLAVKKRKRVPKVRYLDKYLLNDAELVNHVLKEAFKKSRIEELMVDAPSCPNLACSQILVRTPIGTQTTKYSLYCMNCEYTQSCLLCKNVSLCVKCNKCCFCSCVCAIMEEESKKLESNKQFGKVGYELRPIDNFYAACGNCEYKLSRPVVHDFCPKCTQKIYHGKIEHVFENVTPGKVFSVDVNSAYPAAMTAKFDVSAILNEAITWISGISTFHTPSKDTFQKGQHVIRKLMNLDKELKKRKKG